MADRELLVEEIRHVRTVHMLLVLAAATVGYLVLAAWTDAPEVLRETEALERDIRGFVADPRVLLATIPHSAATYHELMSIVAPTDDLMDGELSRGVLQGSERVVQFGGLPSVDNSSIETLRAALNNTTLQFQHVSRFDLSATAVDWIRGGRSSSTAPRDGGNLTSIGHGPRLMEVIVSSWPKRPGEMGLARIRLRMLKTTWTPAVQGTDGLYHGSGGKIENHVDMSYDVRFEAASVETVRVAPKWFAEHYPHLDSRKVQAMTCQQIRYAALSEAESKLREGHAKFADLEIQGQYIAIVAPIALIGLLIYLIACLHEILRFLDAGGTSPPLIPFVGGAPGAFSCGIAWLTFSLIPAITLGIVFWRVRESRTEGILIGSITFLIGAHASRLARRLPTFPA